MADRVHTLLEKLISFNTTSSNSNLLCIDFIRDTLEDVGIKSTLVADDSGTKACLWATIGPEDKPGIVLAGHSDTVPVEGQEWASDPFTMTERDGKLFGRGACDMKGFIACAMTVAPELLKAKLTRPVHFAFTYDEETSMEGAQRLTNFMRANAAKPEWVWIGEPTLLRMIDQHKGVAAYETRITGIPAHSGKPDLGLNAIDLGTEFMGVLMDTLAAKRAKPFQPSRFDPPFTTINLGVVKGGTAENIIAEHFDLTWQVRCHPGDDLPGMLKSIEDIAASKFASRFKAFAPHAGMKICTCFDIPPLMPTPANPGQKLLGELTGYPETEAVSFATEAGFFQSLGTHAIICGPGSIDQAHKANEFVDKNQLSSCIDLLRKALISSAPH